MAPDRRSPTCDRPSIDIGVSLEEWNVFTRRWEAFRRGSRISNESVSSQLFQCATKNLGDNLLQSNAEIVSKLVQERQELLLAMLRLAVIPVAISVLGSELLAMHQMRGEQFRVFAARIRGKAGTCSFFTDCSCGLNVDYTDHIIRDILLNGIFDEDIRRDSLGTADIPSSFISTVIALVESKEIARNAVPSTDIASVSTFKRSTRAIAQGSSLASAYNLPPTFTNHSTHSHCPRCNQLFSLCKEGPLGGILNLTPLALTAIGLVDARNAATAMLQVPPFKLYSHLTQSRPTWVSSTRSTRQSRSVNPHPWRQRTVRATLLLIRSSKKESGSVRPCKGTPKYPKY